LISFSQDCQVFGTTSDQERKPWGNPLSLALNILSDQGQRNDNSVVFFLPDVGISIEARAGDVVWFRAAKLRHGTKSSSGVRNSLVFFVHTTSLRIKQRILCSVACAILKSGSLRSPGSKVAP